jgi:hypothetical protein
MDYQSSHRYLMKIGDGGSFMSSGDTQLRQNSESEKEAMSDTEDPDDRHSKSVSVATYIMQNAGVTDEMIDSVIHRFFQRSMSCSGGGDCSPQHYASMDTNGPTPRPSSPSPFHSIEHPSPVASRRASRRRLMCTLDQVKETRESMDCPSSIYRATIGSDIPQRIVHTKSQTTQTESLRPTKTERPIYCTCLPYCFQGVNP